MRAGPSTHAPRRGTVRVGTFLPVEARVRGQGCPNGEWYRIGVEQYVCESLIRPSFEAPHGEAVPALALREQNGQGALHQSHGSLAKVLGESYFSRQLLPVYMGLGARFSAAEFALLPGYGQAYGATHSQDLPRR